MTETSVLIKVTYIDGKEIFQKRLIEYKFVANSEKQLQRITNKVKQMEKDHKRFNKDIKSIELVKRLNYTVYEY